MTKHVKKCLLSRYTILDCARTPSRSANFCPVTNLPDNSLVMMLSQSESFVRLSPHPNLFQLITEFVPTMVNHLNLITFSYFRFQKHLTIGIYFMHCSILK